MTFGLKLSTVLPTSLPRIDPFGALQRMDAVYRERRRLEELSPEILRDIGLTTDDIAKMLGRD